MASGEVLGWLNSDDTYLPDAISRVATEYRRDPFTWCFGNCIVVDENDGEIRRLITAYKRAQSRRYSYRRLVRRDFISQPAAFFTRKAYNDVGDISVDLNYSMDYDYWLRLANVSEPRYIDADLAAFRWYRHSKNGAQYAEAAWETYQTARRHVGDSMPFDTMLHHCHYHVLRVLYRFI